MEPDRFEWLKSEQERVAQEGTGWQSVRCEFYLHAQRMGGLVVSWTTFYLLIEILPRNSLEATKDSALAGTCAFIFLTAAVALRRSSDRPVVVAWALWTALAFSGSFGLIAAFALLV